MSSIPIDLIDAGRCLSPSLILFCIHFMTSETLMKMRRTNVLKYAQEEEDDGVDDNGDAARSHDSVSVPNVTEQIADSTSITTSLGGLSLMIMQEQVSTLLTHHWWLLSLCIYKGMDSSGRNNSMSDMSTMDTT